MGLFYSFDYGSNGVGNVFGIYWVLSGGMLIFVDLNSDLLYVGLNVLVFVL